MGFLVEVSADLNFIRWRLNLQINWSSRKCDS